MYISSIGEWETKLLYNELFLVLQPKNHHLHGCTRVGMSTQVKKENTRAQGYKQILIQK